MSSTQLTTYQDLYLDLLQRTRNDRNATATLEQAKRWINVALHDVHLGYAEKMPWAERQAVLITHPLYQEGTATISAGLDFVFGIATSWNTDNVYNQQNVRGGGKFHLGGAEYEVAEPVLSTSAPLTSVYVGADIAAESYVYYEDEYDLAPDFARPVDLQRFTESPFPISIESRTDFRRLVAGRYVLGPPTSCSIVERAFGTADTPSPRKRIRLWPIPDRAHVIPYAYITTNLAVSSLGAAQAQLVEDSDIPIIPLRYRHLLVYHALADWYRDKKDDTRSTEARAAYESLLARAVGDSEIGSPRTRISPRVGPYRARSRRPWNGAGGRFDVGGRFDRLEDRDW